MDIDMDDLDELRKFERRGYSSLKDTLLMEKRSGY